VNQIGACHQLAHFSPSLKEITEKKLVPIKSLKYGIDCKLIALFILIDGI